MLFSIKQLKQKGIFLFVFCFFSFSCIKIFSAENEVIYGIDDRVLVTNSTDKRFISWSSSTAALVNNISMTPAYGGFLTRVDANTLEHSAFSTCSGENFSQSLSASFCSGFLVADDLLVTAAHCMFGLFECQNYSWVFDFRSDLIVQSQDNEDDFFIDPDTVYGCEEIAAQGYDPVDGVEYSVIKLKRPVTDRPPLRIRKSGKVSDAAVLAMPGHPLGLPAIMSIDGSIRTNDNAYTFLVNIDSYNGNSGAPIINMATGLVEGLLLSGEEDFVFDQQNQCFVSKVCENDTCSGESVLRISTLLQDLTLLL